RVREQRTLDSRVVMRVLDDEQRLRVDDLRDDAAIERATPPRVDGDLDPAGGKALREGAKTFAVRLERGFAGFVRTGNVVADEELEARADFRCEPGGALGCRLLFGRRIYDGQDDLVGHWFPR